MLGRRRQAVIDLPWTWVSQVHGARVVVASEPGQHAGATADAVVTSTPGVVVAVHTADCAPVFFDGGGAVGVAHAGWRGLAAGVLEATVEAMDHLGHRPRTARLGPCIRARCYEFDGPELHQMVAAYGPSVRAETAWGTPALDLASGVRMACDRLGIPVDDDGICTACSPRHWSYRARADTSRQALAAWISPEPDRK